MAMFSASALIRAHALFILLPLAYAFTFAPEYIASSTIVWTLGESLQLPDRAAARSVSSSPETSIVLVLAAALHVSLRPPPILPSSAKYNVVTFSSAHTLTTAWMSLAQTLTATFIAGLIGIYLAAQKTDNPAWAAVADRTLFTACFLEFFVWFSINSALREELGELGEIGRLKAEDWGIAGTSVRVD